MKARNLVKNDKGKQNIVWFGSCGTKVVEGYTYTLKVKDASKLKDTIIYSFTSNGRVQHKIYIEGGVVYRWTRGIGIKPPSTVVLEPETKVLINIKNNTRLNHGDFDHQFDSWIIDPRSIKAENYATDQHGVATSLIARLSIIKGELWYKASYGLPLMDKIKNKGIYDSIIINIINEHPDVKNITYFNSSVENHKYIFNFIVNTIYSEEVEINYIL